LYWNQDPGTKGIGLSLNQRTIGVYSWRGSTGMVAASA
jgi:hypothetical protein